jgi:bifunctional ADP-heptose synthase (sugar kinase/adenylyltransferase)
VKGSDYKPEDVVGRKTVEQHGGKVELVSLKKDFLQVPSLKRSGLKRNKFQLCPEATSS